MDGYGFTALHEQWCVCVCVTFLVIGRGTSVSLATSALGLLLSNKKSNSKTTTIICTLHDMDALLKKEKKIACRVMSVPLPGFKVLYMH